MAKKVIFIGSSSEKKEIAAQIAIKLSERGFDIRRWWESISPGQYTMNALVSLAQSVDAAIFLMTQDDIVNFRNIKTIQPRDNVLIEYGLFLGHLSQERTIILKEKGDLKLASDISSITYENLEDDITSTSDKLIAHLQKIFSTKDKSIKAKIIPTVIDWDVMVKQLLPGIPSDWRSTALYLGAEGAKNWIKRLEDFDDERVKLENRVVNNIIHLLKNAEIRTLVSFGPGNGDTDKEVIAHQMNRESWLRYIPVDINEYLLSTTTTKVSELVEVPVSIQSDFEKRLAFIKNTLNDYAKHPITYALFGGTFGNMDGFETPFLNTLKSFLETGDQILLDITIKGENWSEQNDYKYDTTKYSYGVKQFICSGISKRTNENIQDLINKFSERIHFIRGESDIPDTDTIHIASIKEKYILLTQRRYNFKSTVDWISKNLGFEVISQMESYDNEKVLGVGLLLLKAKK